MWRSPPAASSPSARSASLPTFQPSRDSRRHAACVVAPGLVDLAARLREPGRKHQGMLESELNAAAAGGVTSLVCPPDTDPALDEPGLVEMLKFRARKLSSLCRLFPLGALTRGLEGRGADRDGRADGRWLRRLLSGRHRRSSDTLVLQRAMHVRRHLRLQPVWLWLRPVDPWLGKGVAASGAVATRLGLSGVPVASETISLHTLFELMRATGVRVHLCRLSAAPPASSWCATAKAEGLPLSPRMSASTRCT